MPIYGSGMGLFYSHLRNPHSHTSFPPPPPPSPLEVVLTPPPLVFYSDVLCLLSVNSKYEYPVYKQCHPFILLLLPSYCPVIIPWFPEVGAKNCFFTNTVYIAPLAFFVAFASYILVKINLNLRNS